MMKSINAVSPFRHKSGCNFKLQPFEAWLACGGKGKKTMYPFRGLRKIIYNTTFPTISRSNKEARLKFAEACSLNFDCFPDYLTHEIIPVVWDCWPSLDNKVINWFRKNKVRTCIFTCEESAKRIKSALPNINILVITEGFDVTKCPSGRDLTDREIDFYSYGRAPEVLVNCDMNPLRKERCGNDDQLIYRWQNSKVVLALPQCDVLPERTGGQETLTQRYWECMLSRMVMIGRAPKELIDLIGYDPVINLNVPLNSGRNDIAGNFAGQVKNIVSHIEDYQELVDKNRETALRMAPWEIRIKQVMSWLSSLGYLV